MYQKKSQPSLVIRGSYRSVGGYGAHIRSHLRILEAAGIPYFLIEAQQDPLLIKTKEIKRWNRLRISKPKSGSVVIHICEAPFFEAYRDCYNVGYCMWETTKLPDLPTSINSDMAWVEKLNQMNEVWTGSNFSKEVFRNSGVQQNIKVVPWAVQWNDESEEKELRLWAATPSLRSTQKNLHGRLQPLHHLIRGLPDGLSQLFIKLGYLGFISLNFFFHIVSTFKAFSRKELLEKKPGEFRVLVSNSFDERKNIKDALVAYLFSFQKNKNVRLVIKTHSSVNNFFIRFKIMMKIRTWMKDLKISKTPKVSLITETISDKSYQQLIASSDCFLNTSRGEGVGGGVLISMLAKKPIITHLFSSFADFCDKPSCFIYDYSLEPVCWHFNYYGDGQQWARPNMESLCDQLERAYDEFLNRPEEWKKRGIEAQKSAKLYSNPEKVTQAYQDVLTANEVS